MSVQECKEICWVHQQNQQAEKAIISLAFSNTDIELPLQLFWFLFPKQNYSSYRSWHINIWFWPTQSHPYLFLIFPQCLGSFTLLSLVSICLTQTFQPQIVPEFYLSFCLIFQMLLYYLLSYLQVLDHIHNNITSHYLCLLFHVCSFKCLRSY